MHCTTDYKTTKRNHEKKKNQCAGHISFRLICRSTIGSYEGYSSTCTPEHRPGRAVHGLTSFTAPTRVLNALIFHTLKNQVFQKNTEDMAFFLFVLFFKWAVYGTFPRKDLQPISHLVEAAVT